MKTRSNRRLTIAYNTGSVPTLAELITAKFIPEIFSGDVITTVQSNLVCAGLFNTSYKKDLRKGYKVSIPFTGAATATEVTPGTEPTSQDLKGTAGSITVDKWYQSSAEISDLMEIEELADYLKAASEECAYSILKQVDTDIGSDFSTLNSSSREGADGQTFTDEIFKNLVEALDEADVPAERFLIGDPSTKRDMLDIDKFMRVDYVRTPVVPTGMFGELYGAKVYITNNLTVASTGHYGVYAHKDAIGVVIQMNPRSRIYDMGYKFLTKIICDCAWGAVELRETFGKAFFTRKS